jgi:hypothetical protein
MIQFTLESAYRWYYISEDVLNSLGFKGMNPWFKSVTWVKDYLPKIFDGDGFDRWLGNHSSYEQAMHEAGMARSQGTMVHNLTELLDKGVTISADTKVKIVSGFGEVERTPTGRELRNLQTYINFLKDFRPMYTGIETTVWSEKFGGVAGTVDRFALIDSGLLRHVISGSRKDISSAKRTGRLMKVVIDIKNSSGIRTGDRVQVAAYVKMADDKKVREGFVLRLGTKSKKGYEFKSVDVKKHWPLFGIAAKMWDFHNEGRKDPKMQTFEKEEYNIHDILEGYEIPQIDTIDGTQNLIQPIEQPNPTPDQIDTLEGRNN